LGVSAQNLTQLGRRADFYVLLSGLISRWILQRNSIEFCANLGKRETENLAIRKAFREESTSLTRSLNSSRQKKASEVKSIIKCMLIILFNIKGIVHKEFVLPGQTVNSTYYCGFLGHLCENVRRLRPELWRQRTGFWITTTHSLTLSSSRDLHIPSVKEEIQRLSSHPNL
jgi:hypothetical protein